MRCRSLYRIIARANKLNDRYATLSAIAEKSLAIVYSNIKIADPAKFKIGDSVYVSKYKTIFKKGYIPNWRCLNSLKFNVLIS